MSEHSAAELKRQLDTARDRVGQAQRLEELASRRYDAKLREDALADYATRGIIPGRKVVAVAIHFFDKTETRTLATFLGVEARYGRVRALLGAVKADGSPSKAPRSISHDRLEPFTEAGA